MSFGRLCDYRSSNFVLVMTWDIERTPPTKRLTCLPTKSPATTNMCHDAPQ